jgi:hypothetical protein
VKERHKIITLLSAVPNSPWKRCNIMAIFTALHHHFRVRVVGTADSYLRYGGFEPGHKQTLKRVLYVVVLSQSSDSEGR